MRIDEITRRDLLKGAGAAIVAGTLSSQAKGLGTSVSLVGDVDKENNTYAGVPVEDLSWQLDTRSKLQNKKGKTQTFKFDINDPQGKKLYQKIDQFYRNKGWNMEYDLEFELTILIKGKPLKTADQARKSAQDAYFSRNTK